MWSLILEIALKLLGLGIKGFQDNEKLHSLYQEFVKAWGDQKSAGVKLHDDYEKQKEELLKGPPKPPDSLL